MADWVVSLDGNVNHGPNVTPTGITLRECMDAHNRVDVACALTSCRECKYRKRAIEHVSDGILRMGGRTCE